MSRARGEDAPYDARVRVRVMQSIAVVSVIVVALLIGGVLVIQRALLFPGQARSAVQGAIRQHPEYEQIWLDTHFGPVEAWYLAGHGSEAVPGPAVLFAHGNGELIDDWAKLLAPYSGLGLALMLVEYPGYGRSAGVPSETSIREAMGRAHEALASRPEVDDGRIVLHGRSLGGAAVATLLGAGSSVEPPAAVILQSTFESVTRLASESFGLPSLLVRDPFDTALALQRYDGPVLIMHGEHDTLIPPEHADALMRVARRGETIRYRCGHNDCPPDWQAFWSDVTRFLARHGLLVSADSH